METDVLSNYYDSELINEWKRLARTVYGHGGIKRALREALEFHITALKKLQKEKN